MKHFNNKNTTSHMLYPLSWVYTLVYKIRQLTNRPYKASVPVICIGNVTVGGTGKTPTCRAVLQQLSVTYKNPVVVSRGYGGNITAPTVVDNTIHTHTQVGDEPLMLSKNATVVVSANKKQGVKYAEDLGADIILLDDGLQNPTVYKDIAVVVVDGYRGFGNGRILPSGCLREHPEKPLKNAHMILVTGIRGDIYNTLKNTYGNKVIFAKYTPVQLPFKHRQSVVPFAGLGNPDKFFETVRECGYPIRAKLSYPDHHRYTDSDLQDLRSVAATAQAKLITTEKDFMRLSPANQMDITPLCVELTFHTKNWLTLIVEQLP